MTMNFTGRPDAADLVSAGLRARARLGDLLVQRDQLVAAMAALDAQVADARREHEAFLTAGRALPAERPPAPGEPEKATE